jgi:ubiquinone/menaquinone biosynthesis C-methylase UbiE
MKIDEFYDSVASEYENIINSPEVNAKLMPKIKELFIKYNITEGSILDVGCGPGNLKSVLGDKFNYTGIDVSEKMLFEAKEKGYQVIKGRTEDEITKIHDKSVDYIISSSTLHVVKDLNTVIENFDRIANKGWLITLPDITENFMKNFPVDEPLYNHVNFPIMGVKEDIIIHGWTSPSANEDINERVVMRLF